MINYMELGCGKEKVFFLHGWKIDSTCFNGLIPALDKIAFNYVFVDQRGYGKSKELPGPYTIQQVALDIIELADELKWENFHIIAHSMGGKVISRLMADVPERIKSAIGITPVPPVKLPFDEEAWKMFSSASSDPAVRKEVFRIATGNRLTETWYEMITAESMNASTPAAFAEYLDSWVNYEFYQDVQGCTVPLKILPGEHDADLTYELMKNTFGNWFENLEIIKLGNCGHYPMYEIPLALAAECESFITKHMSK